MKRLEDKAISEGDIIPPLQPLTVKYARYCGEYVVISNTGKVIAHGKDYGKAIDETRKKGIEIPVIIRVPSPNMKYIYNVA